MTAVVNVLPLAKGQPPPVQMTDGITVVGGAARRYLTGEPQDSDVDVIAADAGAMVEFVKVNKLRSEGRNLNGFAFNWRSEDGKVFVQELRRGQGQPWLQYSGGFDFELCRMAWTGSELLATTEALVDVRDKTLTYRPSDQPDRALMSMRRALKYAKSGYVMTNASMLALYEAMRSMSIDEERQCKEWLQEHPNTESGPPDDGLPHARISLNDIYNDTGPEVDYIGDVVVSDVDRERRTVTLRQREDVPQVTHYARQPLDPNAFLYVSQAARRQLEFMSRYGGGAAPTGRSISREREGV